MATQTFGSGGTRTDINALVANWQTIDPFSTIQEGLCTSGGLTTSSGQVISGFDENGQGWVIRANTGASFREHASAASNPLFYDSTKGAFIEKTSTQATVIDASVTNGTIKDLQIKKNDAGYNNVIHISDSGRTVNLDSLIVHMATGQRAIIQRKGDIRRTLVVCEEGDGVLLSSGGGTVDRLTVRRLNGAGGTGISRDYGTWTLTNVAAAGWSTDATGTFTSTHCATDLATGGFGATGRQNSLVAATEWESATADFRVKSTSAKLKDNGTGSSVDIIGQSASGTVDIGAWEFQAGGGATDATVNLTGLAGTGAVGTIGKTVSAFPTGVGGIGAAGSVLATLIPSLAGVSATGQVGSPTINLDSTASLTGVAGTGQVGSPTPTISPTITGVAGAGSVGTIDKVVSVVLGAATAAGAVGTITVDVGGNVTLVLTGVEATASVGLLSLILDSTATLTGVEAQAMAGTITVTIPSDIRGRLIRRTRRRWRPWIKQLEKQIEPEAKRPPVDELRLELESVQDEIRLASAASVRDDQQIALMERTLSLLGQVIDQAEEDELEDLLLTL